ncbi:MAG: MBOAT family protein [Lachnospiraceae bacterium]|nr:MBOAT family protein [Lachnospiraceae bacterium]
MLFSSITFLYFFLPLTLLLYGVVPKQVKNLILFVMSCIFYAWGEPVYLFLMLIQIVIVYGLTLIMEKKRETKTGKVMYVLAVLIPFASLFFFKYFSFLLGEVLGVIGSSVKTLVVDLPLIGKTDLLKITLPIGISFYTFQLVSYVVDVWRRECVAQRSVLKLATYITMFPQLIAGPIVRYRGMDKELDAREVSSKDYTDGIVRFVIGLGKKVLIANVLGEIVQELADISGNSIVLAWMYAIAVTLQIYFDFSGYSDMAIGLGAMFGFSFPENFNYPLISGSLTEFWRRWHMSLGSWFRDYVYIPLGGNRTSTVKWIRNILVVWMLTGVWHGAGWNFIVWGLFFGVMLLIEKFIAMGILAVKERGAVAGDKTAMHFAGHGVKYCLRHIYVIVAIVFSFLIFNGANLSEGWQDINNLWSAPVRTDELSLFMLRNRAGILFVGAVGATPLPKYLWEKAVQGLGKGASMLLIRLIQLVFTAILLLLCTAYLIDGSFNPFLYFRF